MSTINPPGIGGVGSVAPQNLDIETLLLSVQMQRSQLIDSQIAAQIQTIQASNNRISALNNALSQLTRVQSAFPADAKPETTIGSKQPANYSQMEIDVNQAINAAGITDLGFAHKSTDIYLTDSTHTAKAGPANVDTATTKGEIDAAITNIKGQIDSAGNTQQMDMLRLQSLTNKRNDAYDIMTNFVKKMADSRSSIISNMR